MARRAWCIVPLALTGCLLGVDPGKGLPNTPTLASPPTLVSPPVGLDDVAWAVDGTRVVVELELLAPLDVDATEVAAGALPLPCRALEGAGARYRCEGTLRDDGVSGPRNLAGTLVDREQPPRRTLLATPALFTADFQAPQAACLLSHRVARSRDEVTFTVTPSEPLASPPEVRASAPEVTTRFVATVEGQHLYRVEVAEGANVDGYVLTVTATDRAGNPQAGDSLCDPLSRTGTLLGRGPQLPPGEDVTVTATLGTTHEGTLRVRDQAIVRVTVPTVEPLDVTASQVSLSGLQARHDPEASTPLRHTWVLSIDQGSGEGPKDLDALLLDQAGNDLRLQRPRVVHVDTVPPEADCLLQPRTARGGEPVVFKVFASEALAGGAPTVTASDPRVHVGAATSRGNEHGFALSVTEDADVPYTLTVTATDLAGNPQVGDGLCAAEEREGRIVRLAPEPLGAPELVAEPAAGDPTVMADATTPRVRAGARLTVRIPTVNPILPEASRVSLGGVVLAPLAGDPAGPNTWAVTLDGSEGEGRKSLDARLVDAVGNETRLVLPALAVVADFLPPELASASLSRTPAFPPADDGLGTVRFAPSDPFTGAAVTASLRLSATETLRTAPELLVVGPGPIDPGPASTTGRAVAWSFSPSTAAEGTHRFEVRLEDEVGNVSAPLDLGVHLVVDRTGELPAPAVDPPDRVVYERSPWGDVARGPSPRFAVRGGTGAAAPGATVLLQTPGGALLGSTTADDLGAFDDLLGPSDLPEVWLVQLDAAGNPGARARVRDVAWTATLGGKRAGSLLENPHELADSLTSLTGHAGLEERTDAADTVVSGSTLLTEGGPAWHRSRRPDAPSARTGAAAAWDPVHEQLVLFGGAGSSARDDTWVHDRDGWRLQAPPGARPSARTSHAMAWDGASQRVLLHGGTEGLGVGHADTWTWDGSRWQEATPANAPSDAIQAHALAWDPVRGELIRFGGYLGGGPGFPALPTAQTWRWDGAGWTLLDPPEAPSARGGAALAWDPVSARLILFGGLGGTDHLDDTWAWDGTTWSELHPPASPPARADAVLAWDPVRETLLLHGGTHLSSRRADTWLWDGATWVPQTPASAPSARSLHVLAHDPSVGGLVLFGGQDGARRADTWTWTGATWAPLEAPVDGPLVRADHALAWDAARGEGVLVGGDDGTGKARTWLWRDRAWEEAEAAVPKRSGHALAWDGAREEVVLFGGSQAGTLLGDTWRWDGDHWTEAGVPGPPPRDGPAMAWDPVAEQVLLHGGEGVDFYLPDTWVWNGSAWTDVTPASGGPGFMDGHGLAWDPLGEVTLLFGGTDDNEWFFPRADTWIWDAGWTRATPDTSPAARRELAMATSPWRREAVVFGGQGERVLGDTWIWRDGIWREVTPRIAGPSPRAGAELAFDPLTGIGLLVGGVGVEDPGTTWILDPGADARPRQTLQVDWSAARAPEAEVRALTARWVAGGIGYPNGKLIPGVTLDAWDGWRWRELARHGAGRNTATLLCATIRASEADPSPTACEDHVDPLGLVRLFTGPGRGQVHLSAASRAPTGSGHPTGATRPYAAVVTDTVEVVVHYRLPEGTP